MLTLHSEMVKFNKDKLLLSTKKILKMQQTFLVYDTDILYIPGLPAHNTRIFVFYTPHCLVLTLNIGVVSC